MAAPVTAQSVGAEQLSQSPPTRSRAASNSSTASHASLTKGNDAPVFDEAGHKLLHFCDQDFIDLFIRSRDLEACIDGWEYTLTVGECDVYRRKRAGQSLYEYTAVGTFTDINPKLFHDAYLDMRFMEEISQFTYDVDFVYGEPGPVQCVTKFPFPLSDRDYVVYRESRYVALPNGSRAYVVMMSGEDFADVRVKRGRVRVKDTLQCMVLEEQPDDPLNPRMYVSAWENPEGSIPAWFVNYVGKFAIPAFMKELRNGTRRYGKYRTQRNLPADAPLPPRLRLDPAAGYMRPMPPKPSRDRTSRTSTINTSQERIKSEPDAQERSRKQAHEYPEHATGRLTPTRPPTRHRRSQSLPSRHSLSLDLDSEAGEGSSTGDVTDGLYNIRTWNYGGPINEMSLRYWLGGWRGFEVDEFVDQVPQSTLLPTTVSQDCMGAVDDFLSQHRSNVLYRNFKTASLSKARALRRSVSGDHSVTASPLPTEESSLQLAPEIEMDDVEADEDGLMLGELRSMQRRTMEAASQLVERWHERMDGLPSPLTRFRAYLAELSGDEAQAIEQTIDTRVVSL